MVALALLSGSVTASGPASPEVKALFFGDSLIVGTGAVPQRPVQVRTAVDRLHWRAVVDARGGTGYTTGGKSAKPYLYRLQHDRFLRTQYDVIVLEGGTNDAHHGSLARLHDDALRTIDFVRSRQKHARIVLVGAFSASTQPVARYATVDQVLAAVALERGLQYVSQLRYHDVTDKGFLAKDQFHPSDEGYAVMGKDLAAALRG